MSYVEDAGDLLVFVDEAAAKLWWRNLRGGAPVRVLLRGHWQVGHAEVAWEADPPGLARALARFAAAWPGFVDLGLPPAERYSPEELLQVAHGCAVVSPSSRVGPRDRPDDRAGRPRLPGDVAADPASGVPGEETSAVSPCSRISVPGSRLSTRLRRGISQPKATAMATVPDPAHKHRRDYAPPGGGDPRLELAELVRRPDEDQPSPRSPGRASRPA